MSGGDRGHTAVSAGEFVNAFDGVLPLLDGTAALRHAATLVAEQFGADLAAAAERVDEDDAVEVRAVVGGRTGRLAGLVVRPPQGLGGQAAALRRTVSVPDYCASPAITHDFDIPVRAEGLRSVMAAPVLRAHRLYGVLYAARRRVQPWSDEECRRLRGLARRVAVAMEVADSAREMADVAVYRERRRTAVRLHDSVGATLFSLRAGLRSLQRLVEPGPVLDRLVELDALAERAAVELRGQARSLHDAPADKALAVALAQDCRELAQRTTILADLVVLADVPAVSPSRAEALRLAVREALLNVEKHSLATSVVVSLFPADDGVGVAVADDGVAESRSPVPDRGLGLYTTAERLERVGGRLSFEVNQDGGRTLRAWVPLTASPPAAP